MYALFAETPTAGPTITEYSAGGVALVLLFALLWFMRHVVTVTIPDLMKTNAETAAAKDAQIGRLVEEFRTEAKEARTEHADSLKVERELRHAERQRQTEDTLKVAVALERNTQETAKLASETQKLSASVGNLANRVEKT